jgi:DNA-binding GntR family transcriptional regulator
MTLTDSIGIADSRSTLTAAEPSLSEFAYNQMLDLMLAGHLPAGAVLQERRLAEMRSISRTPVREALARLEVESLVSRRNGRMLFVADVSVESYISLLDMRRILEMETAARATGRFDPAVARKIADAIAKLVDLPRITPAQHWAVDDMVHSSIADAAGNPMVATSIRELRRRTHIFNTARIPHRLVVGAGEHMALIDAVMGDDPERSRKLMADHIDNVRDAIIDFILGRRAS